MKLKKLIVSKELESLSFMRWSNTQKPKTRYTIELEDIDSKEARQKAEQIFSDIQFGGFKYEDYSAEPSKRE